MEGRECRYLIRFLEADLFSMGIIKLQKLLIGLKEATPF